MLGNRRMEVFKWFLCAMVLSGMALCPRLWIADRSFPTIPVVGSFGGLGSGITVVLSILFVLSILVAAVMRRHQIPVLIALAGGLVLVAFDINRLQPWIYQAFLLFAILGFVTEERGALAACQFVFVALYFWSGIQKVNPVFKTAAFPWLLQPFHLEALKPFWFLAPILECGIGLALAFRRTRLFGVIGACSMHLLLLIDLGPFGANANSVIWPWNFWMILLNVALFYKAEEGLFPSAWKSLTGKLAIVLAGVMPALSFAGRWDQYLSASLYSGKPVQAMILFTSDANVPPSLSPFVKDLGFERSLDITRWAIADLNVPPYPEVRIYRAVERRLQSQGVTEQTMQLFIADPLKEDGYRPLDEESTDPGGVKDP